MMFKRICEQCGIEYSNIYKSRNSKYTIKTRFCSKQCASRFKCQNNERSIIKPLPNKEEIIDEIIEFIKSKGRYCSNVEIRQGINRSSKSLTKLNISLADLNLQLGFIKPKSKFENEVYLILTQLFETVITQKEFDGLVGTKGHPLKVDFFIPKYNIVIEADGSQHANQNHIWYNTNPNGSVKLYDEIKNNYFDSKGISIIRIPYKRRVTTEYVQKFLNI